LFVAFHTYAGFVLEMVSRWYCSFGQHADLVERTAAGEAAAASRELFFGKMVRAELLKVAQGCSRLLKVAQGCSRLLKVAQGCSRLLKVAQGCLLAGWP